MDEQKKEAILKQLETEVREVGAEVSLSSGEDGRRSLSFMAPMYDDGSGLVFFELDFASYGDEYTLFQIFATLLPEIGDALPELEKAVARWNLPALCGAYGVYDEADQLYFKYRFLLDGDAQTAYTVDRIMDNLYLAYDEVSGKYDTAVKIAEGKLDFEGARAAGLC